MKKTGAWTVAIALLASAGSLAAHHSIGGGQFDTETPVRVKGTIVRFDLMNPHSRIHLDRDTEDGQVQRWVVDSPGLAQLTRQGVAMDVLKAGDVIEVCGFEGVGSQQTFLNASLDASSPSLPERFMNGTLLVMPDGRRRLWSDYGLLEKCLGPGETRDSLVR